MVDAPQLNIQATTSERLFLRQLTKAMRPIAEPKRGELGEVLNETVPPVPEKAVFVRSPSRVAKKQEIGQLVLNPTTGFTSNCPVTAVNLPIRCQSRPGSATALGFKTLSRALVGGGAQW